MAQITAKELTAISDLLTMEETLAAKCCKLASECTDSVLKNQYEQVAQMHRQHYDELFANLK